MPSRHLADYDLAWSRLNADYEILDAAAGRVRLTPARRKVLIYGAGLGKHLAAPLLEDPDWEVWCLNLIPALNEARQVRADRWFDIHQRAAQTPDDLRWIAKCPRPIYVPDDLLDAGPTCVRLPHERLETFVGGAYWACTFAYQIALALAEGFEEIALFGVELSQGTRRERSVEWACVSWWMGYAEAKGTAFRLPAASRLGHHKYRYGLEYQREIDEVNDYLHDCEDYEADEIRRAREARREGRAAKVRESVGG